MFGSCCLCFSQWDSAKKCAILAVMRRTLEYQITAQENKKTILDYLKSKGYSHNLIVHLKKTPEGIQKNGIWSYVSDPLKEGDWLKVHWEETEGSDRIEPICLPFPVIYEDEDILVVNKPAGMPIHPSMNNYDNTLANAAMHYFKEKGESFTYRCVNRLDRDTSGLTILAKNMLSAAILSRNTGLKAITREYLAVVYGNPPESGTVDAPIARAADSAIERCVDYKRGESAITHYRRLRHDSEKNLSLIRLTLETGRTHQIRVHMKHIGFPLIGDFLYNPDFTHIKRQALHSACLSFIHPITGEPMRFEAPLPEDMDCLFPLNSISETK